MRPAARRIACCGCRVALAVALVGAAGAGVLAGVPATAGVERAWADNLDNAAVPTDDTGVVDSSAAEEAPAEIEGSAAARPAPGTEEAADGASEGETADDEGAQAALSADGAAPAEEGKTAEGAEAAESETPQIVPDLVFGMGVNENNLMSPQQKPDSSFIYDTSIKALQEADPYLNDQTVQVTGEVVGDRIKAEFDPGFCWIVLQSNDGQYTEVPIFLDQALTESIDTYGAYGRKGTTLQVRGTFHLACPDHEGLTDLHADTVSVVSKGYVGERKLDPAAFVPGVALTAAGLLMLLVFRHMREGRR
ncbi:hypothetical protein [Adlercreutzia caecimuris]|uniref:hypothetical protein n=1 Tax=Adlercreutzia caecimuris TaxID=671266 RepID=UPI002495855B|nr:hypothetical protein [Adlercreutzia caecimuris]